MKICNPKHAIRLIRKELLWKGERGSKKYDVTLAHTLACRCKTRMKKIGHPSELAGFGCVKNESMSRPRLQPDQTR